MWIVLIFTGLVLMIAHALWLSSRLWQALAVVLPGHRPWWRISRIVYRVVACALPVLTLGFALYAVIARPPELAPPQSRVLDYLVVYPFWVVTIHGVQCSLFVLPLELAHFVARKLGRATHPRWAWRKSAAIVAVAALFGLYVPVRIAIDDRSLSARGHDLPVRNLPAELDGFEIALVADMQADVHTDRDRLGQLVDAVNAEQPDLILIAGDMITREPRWIDVAAEYAGRMKSPHGVWACVGDHDNFAYRDRGRSLREVIDALARHGVAMLDNDVRTFTIGGAEIAVVFATNNYVSRIDRDQTARLLDRARSADVKIVVAHQTAPGLLDQARRAGAELFLSGHTHGGQIRWWSPLGDLALVRWETPYLAGAYQLGSMLLVVTNGLGVSVAPFRYRAPATFDLIRLRRM